MVSEADTRTGESPADENADRARRIVGALNDRDRATLESLVAEDVVGHSLGTGSTRRGRDDWLDRHFEFADHFPDLHLEVEDVVADDERAMVRLTMTGTWTEPFDGWAPSGRSGEAAGFHVLHFAHGQVVEWWRLTDLMTWTDGIDAVPRDPRSFARIVARQLRWKLTGGR